MAKKKPATVEERRHMNAVADLGCIVCGMPCELHHIRSGVGIGQRSSHFSVIPLCPSHHRTGGYRVAIHSGKKSWESIYGSEVDLLAQTLALLENSCV